MTVATQPPEVDNTCLQLQAGLTRKDFRLDVNLRLPGHGVTALFGPSGSGKTTVLRLLAGLETQVCGRIVVLGKVWQDSAQGIFRPVHQRALGYVFQEASLFDHLNVEGNLKFGFRRTPVAERRHAWNHALELLGIGHLLQRWPHELSGGERQRVAIARALANNPRLLLLDEPLAALDAPRKTEILFYLGRMQAELNIPVIYVSHAIDEVARLADHLVLLDAGKVSASGPTAELLTRLDLPLAHGDGAAAVLTVTVLSHDLDDHLTTVSFSGGTLVIPKQPAAIRQRLRIRVQARDVSLTLEKQTGTSILNILSVNVTALTTDSPGQMMVALDSGGSTLLARITSRSAHLLGLAPGLALFAQIKGVAILG